MSPPPQPAPGKQPTEPHDYDSSTSPGLATTAVAEEEEDRAEAEVDANVGADMPLTMAASVVLSNLPRDAHEALEAVAREGEGEKVTIHLVPLGSARPLKQNKFKLLASKRFDTVLRSLRRRLLLKEAEGVFCYVNQTFSPAPDEGIGNLWRCFKVNDALVVHYAVSPAYG